MKRGISFSWTTFDRWYCTKQVVRKVEEHNKYFVSKLKINRVVVYRGERMQASNLVTVAAASSASEETPVDLGCATVQNLGDYRIIVRGGECFITNSVRVAPEEVVRRYEMRWPIDDFYKQAKENLSFGHFQIRKGLPIMRHWMLVFLAYAFYMQAKLKGVSTKITTAAVKTLGDFRRTMQNLNFVRAAEEKTDVLMAELGLRTVNERGFLLKYCSLLKNNFMAWRPTHPRRQGPLPPSRRYHEAGRLL